MKKAHASSNRQHKTSIRIIPLCVWCRSSRIRFYQCDDDWGTCVSVRCDACEAQGPGIRAGIGAPSGVTHAMKREAAEAWNVIWCEIVSPPAEVVVDLVGDDETWHRHTAPRVFRPRRPARPRPAPLSPAAPAALAPPITEPRYFTCKCPSEKHGELTGCSGTGSSMTEGLCACCVAECRKADHAVHVVTPPKATNGHNGHHNGHGSVA
jgi:hypothetical protein